MSKIYSYGSLFLWYFMLIGLQLDIASANLIEKIKYSKPNHRILKKEAEFSGARKKHKKTEEFVQKLEFAAIHESMVNALEFGLVPIDLMHHPEFAYEVEAGVDDELTQIGAELGDEPMPVDKTTLPEHSELRGTSLIYQGMYTPAQQYNQMVDKVIRKVKRDMRRRNVDPLYFMVHEKGNVRHSPKNENPIDFLHDKERTRNAVGGGALRGLLRLKRFGHAESLEEPDRTLVRSHFFFGPLQIAIEYMVPPRVQIINSTLSSLAGHALFAINKADNSTTLLDFITDSPLEYEIRLRGSKHPEYQEISRTAITRLFRRNGRMETRFQRFFLRAVRPRKKNNKKSNTGAAEPLSENVKGDVEVLDRSFTSRTPTAGKQPPRRILDDE